MLLIDKNATKRHKPLITADSERPAYFVHPHITADQDPLKGRLLRASAPVPAGTILLVDTAYAIVPVNSAGDETTICSNLACSRRVPQNGTALRCPRGCIRDVIWCNTACRATDIKRHQYECLWLKRNGDAIQSQERQYDFATLWHVVRLLASWNLDLQGRPSKSRPSLSDRRFEEGWEAVESCCDYLDSWPESQVKHWTRLINMYLSPISGLPYLPAPDKLLSLICKEETNTFGLYPKVTGPLYAVDPSVSRGECYGYGLYPRAARFNHSCLPNVSHSLPLQRM